MIVCLKLSPVSPIMKFENLSVLLSIIISLFVLLSYYYNIQTFMNERLKLHLNLQKSRCAWRGLQCLERTIAFIKKVK